MNKLNKCRTILNNLDDSTIKGFCLDYFQDVYDMFASGTLRTDKIFLLLDHCRKNKQVDYLLQCLNERQKQQEARYGSPSGYGNQSGYGSYSEQPRIDMSRIRKGLLAMFPHDSDFMAFTQDYFPRVHQKFGGGMQKTQKINLLLDHCRRTDKWLYLAESLVKVKGESTPVVIQRLQLPMPKS